MGGLDLGAPVSQSRPMEQVAPCIQEIPPSVEGERLGTRVAWLPRGLNVWERVFGMRNRGYRTFAGRVDKYGERPTVSGRRAGGEA